MLCSDGECITPLVFVQLGHTRGSTLVCGCCGGFAAGARGQLVAKELPTSAEALDEALRQVPGQGSHQAAYCSLGCGEIFCSPECEARAQATGHGLMCVGPLTEEAPMYHLKVVALHSGQYETLVLATKLVAKAASGDEASCRFLRDALPAHAPWAAAEGDGAVAEELLDYIGQVYNGPAAPRVGVLSWHLLAAALGAERLPAGLSLGTWARLLGYVSRRGVPPQGQSHVPPLAAWCPGWWAAPAAMPPRGAPGGSAQLGSPRVRPRPLGAPPTASGARASRLQSRRCHRL